MEQRFSVKFDNEDILSFVQGQDAAFQLTFNNDTEGKPVDLTDAEQVAVHFPRKGGGVIKRRKVGFPALNANTNISTGYITVADHGLVEDEVVQLSTTGTLPTGYSTSTDYKIAYIDENNFGLKNATTGVLIKPSTQGSGGYTVTQQNCVAFATSDNPILGQITVQTPLVVTSAVQEGLGQGFQCQYVDSTGSLKIDVLANGLDVTSQPTP